MKFEDIYGVCPQVSIIGVEIDPIDKILKFMRIFTFKKLLLTAVFALSGLFAIQANAQITLSNVQGSESSSPYIYTVYMDGWTYNELRWDGYVSFTAEGYTLPVEINVMGTSGTNCSRYITVEDDTTGMFMVDNLIPGTYVIQMTDNNGNTGTYEQGVTVGEGSCDENVFLSSRFENNSATVFIADNTGAEAFGLDSIIWHVYRDGSLVVEEGSYGMGYLNFPELEDLEYGLYNVEAQAYANNCSWTTMFEANYADLCEGFWYDLLDLRPAGLENNEGSVSVIVGGPVDNVNFWGVVHDAENYYENNQYIDNAWDSVTVSGLAEGDYMFEISYNNGNCNDTMYFTIERECNLYVNVSRLSDSNDTLTLMPNVMFAQAYTFNENRDTVKLNNAQYIWNDGFYGAYYEYQDLGEAYELFVDYNGCELMIEGSCDEENMTPSCYSPMSEVSVTYPSASNNNGAITNVGFGTSDMFPYHVFVFNEDGDFIGSNYLVSETDLEYVFDGLAGGTYRIYEYKEDVTGMCTSFTSVELPVNCETMEVSVEIVSDSTSNVMLIAEVMDTQEETQIYPDDNDYEWYINGNVYHGRILNTSEFVEFGLLEYSYMLNVNHNDCIASTEGDYIVDINCTMSASVTGITPMNLAADSDYAYAIVSISVNNGTAPYMVNDNGSNDYGAWYETDSFEYYLYDDEMQETPMTLYVIDAFGCTDTVEISGMLTCEMSASLTYNSSSDVVINIIAEGDDYYPVSIYCENFSDSFIGSTTTSTFSIPENRLTAWGRYEIVAANGCVTEVWVDESEICNMELVNYTISNPTSAEIENGSVTIELAGGVAPYYGTYYKLIDEENSFYYHYATNDAPIVISNLSVGEYIIGVMDVRGCMVIVPSDSTTITLESDCQIVSYSQYNNGSVAMRINNGTAPYVITLENGNTYTADADTLTIENITPGMHFYTIVDARGCSEFSTIEAVPADCENVQISVTGNVVNATSLTNPNGSISLTVTGGEAPYTYYWINGETTESISGLYPDEYWVYVNDNNGCYGAEIFNVEYVPSENLFDELYIDVNYHIEVITVPTSDGPVDVPFAVAHVQAIAGVPPYSYEWNVPSTYSDQQALAIYESGAVCVNVTDAANNEVSGCLYIELPSADQISNEIIEEVAGIVDTCINSSAIADAHVTNVELEAGTQTYHVTWVLIEKDGPVHELTVDYPVDSLATGIYAFNLYLRCNGQRAVTSFSTRLYLTGGTESVEEAFAVESSVNAYPNPFNDMLNIVIDAAENDNVTINVYNVSGQMIYTTNTQVSNGENNIEIATSNYGAGVYFINVVGNSINETIKVVK